MRISQKHKSIIKTAKWLPDKGLWINRYYRKLKNWLKTKLNSMWSGFLSLFIKRPEVPLERLGSAYGGWTIYPLGLNKNSIVYSLGIGEDISFDLALIERFGCQVFAFDPTPRSIEWLKTQDLPEQFRWYKIGIADYDGEAEFYPPENPNHISHTILYRPQAHGKAIVVKVNRLQTILKKLGHNHINILKMDIEGAEYSVIKDMFSTNIRPEQILVEYHHFFKNVSTFKTIQATTLLWL